MNDIVKHFYFIIKNKKLNNKKATTLHVTCKKPKLYMLTSCYNES